MRLPWMVPLRMLLLAGWPAAAAAQEWDTPAATELVARATQRREQAEAPDGLRRWDARARGVVLFLTQVGDAATLPRLVKADELAVEVYWEAPGRSKQTILAWRDQIFLPTDIRYHRDHLGIVANDFGPMIRIGEGDEVRDVPHPLSSSGRAAYQFALVDSLTVASDGREWQVHAVQVRPRDPELPGVVGTLFLDRGSAAVVRFRFSFTAAAYRESTLEDITVVLENALQDGGTWLPWRQEIEIRRRASLVELPVRGIIRGRWELSDHRLGEEAPRQSVAASGIGGLLSPGGPPDSWDQTLATRVRAVMGPVELSDLAALRYQVRQWLGDRATRPGPPVRFAFGSLSDLARFNRVEGLRLGIGASIRVPMINLTAAPWVGMGLASHRASARLRLAVPAGSRGEVRLQFERAVVDAGQSAVISPALNSVLAQEFGVDRGDWVERERIELGWDRRGANGIAAAVGAAWVRYRPTAVVARAAHGSFRPNPGFARDGEVVIRAQLERPRSLLPGSTVGWRLGGEVGAGTPRYARVDGEVGARQVAGTGELRLMAAAGWGSGELPAVRGFALGGWGTLPGVPFRELRGSRHLLARLEWLVPWSLPAVALGSFPAVEPGLLAGPFLALGVVGGGLTGPGWVAAGGTEPVVGVAMEGVFGSVRLELGYSPQHRRYGMSLDLVSDWWRVL